MCVIVTKPAGIIIPWETLQTCFDNNDDGAGFSVAKDGKLTMIKGLFKFEDFQQAYEPYKDAASVIHFRIKTHGEKNEENCHPFEVTPDLHMAHNGVISINCDSDKTKSDTWHFVEWVVKPEIEADPACLSRLSFRFLMGSCISYSKLAFIDKDGNILHINKAKGTDGEGELAGCWFSNDTFKTPRYSAYPNDDLYYGQRRGTGRATVIPLAPATTNTPGRGPLEACTEEDLAGWLETQDSTVPELLAVIEELRSFGYLDSGIYAMLSNNRKLADTLKLEVELAAAHVNS